MKNSLLLSFAFSLVLGGCASRQAYHSGRDGLLDDPGGRGYLARHSRKSGAETLDLDSSKSVRSDVEAVAFRWPLSRVEVTSSFGKRGADMHEGVDLRAMAGTPVFASAPGKVLYSGNQIRGYGRLVVLRHANGLSSVYAHNSKLLVIQGQNVKRGQLLARSGKSGHVSGPHVHFEIRKGVTPLDPERAIAKTLVALPLSELQPARHGRLAAASLSRDDSGHPPVNGLRQVRLRANERHRHLAHRYHPLRSRALATTHTVRPPHASKNQRAGGARRESYSATSNE